MSRKQIINFNKKVFNRTGMPVIDEVGILGKYYSFIIDTGANECVITPDFYKELDKQMNVKIINKQIQSTGVGGETAGTNLVCLPIDIGKDSIDIEFQVLDINGVLNFVNERAEIKAEGLIGSRLLNQLKYILDFDKLIMYK